MTDSPHKRFDAVEALSDVSFSLSGNKICGLLGRDGASKTTLLSIMAGLERQTGGTVLVDCCWSPRRRRRWGSTAPRSSRS